MNAPNPLSSAPLSDPTPDPRRSPTLRRVPELPSSVLRSRAPGYVLAAATALALGGWITWKVVHQAEAIQTAQTRTPPVVTEQIAMTPTAVLVEVPRDPAAAASSQTTTTGAEVPAPSATPPSSTPHAAEAFTAGESQPTSTAQVIAAERGTSAPEPGAPRIEPVATARIAPATHRASPTHRSTKKAADPDNPYDSESTSAPASSAQPESTHLFDARD